MSRVDSSVGAPVVCDDQGTYHAYHDVTEDGVSTTVTLALAEITDREPEEVLSRFTEYADPDALDRLFRPGDGSGRLRNGLVRFPVDGYEVTVHGDGEIEIRPYSSDST